VKHTEFICKGGHDYISCQFCDGGLFACTVCDGAEGSLPTDCPGTPSSLMRFMLAISTTGKEEAGELQMVPEAVWEIERFCLNN
jgi:hypothetical protein